MILKSLQIVDDFGKPVIAMDKNGITVTQQDYFTKPVVSFPVSTLTGSPLLIGDSVTALTNFSLRDTSAAFDVILAAVSSTTLTANRTLTLNMGNVAHTINLGTTANAITFPNVASGTVPLINNPQVWTATQTFANVAITSGQIIYPITVNTTLTLDANTTTSAIAGVTFANAGGSFIGTSGAQRGLEAIETFAPTSGTATFSLVNLTPTINQTGGASGVTSAVAIAPTLTAAAAFTPIDVQLALVAGGARVMKLATSGPQLLVGSGVPTLSANQGSMYIRSDGSSTSTRAYINTDGSTTWTSITTAT